jgi:hypothetical protein
MIKEVRNNYNSPVIASEAKQSHSVKTIRLLRRYTPRNDSFADLRLGYRFKSANTKFSKCRPVFVLRDE